MILILFYFYIIYTKFIYNNDMHWCGNKLASTYEGKGASMKKNNKQNDGVQRGLKDRHISMIAIGDV